MSKDMQIIRNAQNNIHCDTGPAMYNDFQEMYFRDGILHREDGPAIHFKRDPNDPLKHLSRGIIHPDDVWILEGVALCESGYDVGRIIVESPELLNYKQISSIKNQEVKRIAIARYGVEKFLAAANAVVLDHAKNEIEGTKEAIYICEGFTYFHGVCVSTGRQYFIDIDPSVKTCVEARKFLTSGKDPKKCVGAT